MECSHHHVVGVEGQLGHPRVGLAGQFDVDAALLRQHDQGALGGVPNQGVVVQHRIGAQGHGHEGGLQVVALSADALDLAIEGIALACDGEAPVGDHQLPRGHLVQGEGSGLVGADGRGGPQGLDRGQALDDGPVLGQLRGAEGEQCGHHRGQAGGNRGHSQGHAHDEQIVDVLSLAQTHQHHQHQRHRGQRGDDDGKSVQLLLQRGLLDGGRVEHTGDMADLGVHARGRDDHLPPSPGDGRVHVGHVDPVAQWDVVATNGVGRLGNRSALARER